MTFLLRFLDFEKTLALSFLIRYNTGNITAKELKKITCADSVGYPQGTLNLDKLFLGSSEEREGETWTWI